MRHLATCVLFCCTLPLWADPPIQNKCGYVDSIVFSNLYARLVNRGPNMLTAYGTVTNNDNAPHTLTSVQTPKAEQSYFRVYRQEGGAGNITAHPIDSITIPKDGGTYRWSLGGPHIALTGFPPKVAGQKLQFGTDFDPNQTIELTFGFSDGCTKSIENVPIRDRMQQ